MIGYKPFCPYDIDLEFYRDARSQFSIHEWIDVIIEAIDYNPDGDLDENGEVSERKKLYFCKQFMNAALSTSGCVNGSRIAPALPKIAVHPAPDRV